MQLISVVESIVVPLPPVELMVSPVIVILSPAVNMFCLEVCNVEMSFVFVVICVCKLELSKPSTFVSKVFIFVIKMSYYIIS